MRSMGESIWIGLEASSNSKGPQAKTTESTDSTKVTYCSIQLGWFLARDGFAKNAMGSRPEAKKCIFSFSTCGGMYGWMDGCYRFFRPQFFPHRCTDWNEIENIPLNNKMKRWLVFGTYRSTNISTLFQYFFSFF